jgi:hypothetical protein
MCAKSREVPAALSKNLVYFTTVTDSRGIASTGTINASKIGLFGPGVYLTSVVRLVNLFVRASAKIPIIVSTPAGTVRILPKLVGGFHPCSALIMEKLCRSIFI